MINDEYARSNIALIFTSAVAAKNFEQLEEVFRQLKEEKRTVVMKAVKQAKFMWLGLVIQVISGLNYKDGDDFSFYIFPSSAYESNEISLNETGELNLTTSNLFKNLWTCTG